MERAPDIPVLTGTSAIAYDDLKFVQANFQKTGYPPASRIRSDLGMVIDFNAGDATITARDVDLPTNHRAAPHQAKTSKPEKIFLNGAIEVESPTLNELLGLQEGTRQLFERLQILSQEGEMHGKESRRLMAKTRNLLNVLMEMSTKMRKIGTAADSIPADNCRTNHVS